MKEPTFQETIFLLAILRLSDNAYGPTIREEIGKITHRQVPYGTLYSHLESLFKKGCVTKSFGAPTAERGGRSRIIYHVTPAGRKALQAACRLQESVVLGLKAVAFEKS
jgi:PadR family transcriptional regulator PadR